MWNAVYGDSRGGTEIMLSRMKVHDSAREVLSMLAGLNTTFHHKMSRGDDLLIENMCS